MNRTVAGVSAMGALLVIVLLLPLLWLASESPASPICGFIDAAGAVVTVPDPAVAPDGHLTVEQSLNAAIILSEVQRLGLPAQAGLIAIATAMAESSLVNVAHGDAAGPDSRGLFQQRLLFYTTIDPMDPVQATRAFLQRLVGVPGWETIPVAEAAQAVQRSAVPGRYEERVPAATGVVSALWTLGGSVGACLPGAVLAGLYTLPVALPLFEAHPAWFAGPHHDYPAVDIGIPAGLTVYAVEGGTVTSSPVGGDCGNGVAITSPSGIHWVYCHGTTPLVPAGAEVRVGDPIMISGYTGTVDPPGPAGAHLHLQIDYQGHHLCPQPALAAWARGEALDPTTLPSTGCSY
jgi:murein DD-endopeptidase MepM/ murein hydrolase activator NlpD